MAKNNEEILIKIINEVVGEENLNKQTKLLKTLKTGTNELTQVYEEQTNTQRKRFTVNAKLNDQGVEQVKVQKETLAQGPRFKMHFLGIMFGGMALNRTMSNLTATSKEWVGIGEIMSTTMGVVMLPATMKLMEFGILPLSEALLSLPEEIQTIIGVTVLGLGALGKIAEFGGQIALGAGAFAIAFPEISAKIASGLTSTLSKNLGKGLVIAVGLTIAWQSVDFIRTGIEEGSLQKELIGVLGTGLGLGLVGLTFLGPVGGALGFTLGVSIGLLIDWKLGGDVGKFFMEDLPNVLGFTNTLKQPLGFLGNIPSLFNIQEQAVGGNITQNGLRFLHQGETVLRKDQAANQGGNVSVTYNVNVSDKREFEQMLRNNNQQLVREVRRIV